MEFVLLKKRERKKERKNERKNESMKEHQECQTLETKKKKNVIKKFKKRTGRNRESNPGLSHPKREFYHLTISPYLVME